MNLWSFTAFILILILIVGSYLVIADEVSGTAKTILIVFLLVLGFYFVFNLSMFKRYFEIVDIPIDASSTYIYAANKFSSVDQLYSISTWIYIEDWNTNFGVEKNIVTFERPSSNNKVKDTVINLDAHENNLLVKYDVYTDNNANNTKTQEITVPNINIQKWVNITVCFNTNNTDTYINGKLMDTDVHAYPIYNPPKKDKSTTKGSMILAKDTGFSGKIGLTRYYSRILSPQDAWNIYKQGPTTNFFGSLLNRYNASFIFYQDNQEVQKLSLM